MSRRQIFAGVLLLSLLILSSVVYGDPADPPLNVQNHVEFWAQNPCMSPPEWIYFTGTEHLVTDTDANGSATRGHFHLNTRGEGVGQTTGTHYQMRGTFNQTGHYADVDNGQIIVNAHQTIIAQGSVPNFVMQFHYRIRIVDGVVVWEETTRTTECPAS